MMKAEIYTTTETGTLCQESIVSEKDPGEENQVLNIYREGKDQTFEGFGGAVTDAAGYVFSLMSPAQQEELLNIYFNEDEMGYGQVRIHMDSCDFSTHMYEADPDADYEATYEIDLSQLRPVVAFPHLPENAHYVDEIEQIRIDQVVIGSCTNGRISDLRAAAEILKGHKIADWVRCIVLPGTQAIYLQAVKEGLAEIFVEAGAAFSTPTCGPCLGGHMGILAAGERAVSTTNRNFVGRMGHVDSEVYLASPAVAAASAITGYITNPADLEKEEA